MTQPTTLPLADAGTPCGQPSLARCPGPETTLGGHEHPEDPRTARGSYGIQRDAAASNRHRSSSDTMAPAEVIAHNDAERIDRDPLNWCPTCQNTLAGCYQAGCGKAREALVLYAWVATRYAVATAVAGFGRDNVRASWISELEDKLLFKTIRGIDSLPYHPDGPPAGKRKSTVAYLAHYATLQAYTLLTERAEIEDPRSLSTNASPRDDGQTGDTDDVIVLSEAWKQQELNEAAIAERDRRTEELEATTTTLRAHLDAAVAAITTQRHTGQDILDTYLNQYSHYLGSVHDDRRYHRTKHNDDLAAKELDVTRRTTWRWRTKRLIPALAAFAENPPPSLNDLQKTRLNDLITWLRAEDTLTTPTEPHERVRQQTPKAQP